MPPFFHRIFFRGPLGTSTLLLFYFARKKDICTEKEQKLVQPDKCLQTQGSLDIMSQLMKAAVMDRLYYLLLRDFCESMSQISGQFRRHRLTSDICWPILEDLLGRQRNRGPLWQMKDTVHHLSRHHAGSANSTAHPTVFLDLVIGAIFHETVRLKELAYLGATYLPTARARLCECELHAPDNAVVTVTSTLNSGKRVLPLLEEAFSHLSRAMLNLEKLTEEARVLMCLAYLGQNGNAMVAAMVRDRALQVERAFGRQYRQFLSALDDKDAR